MSLPAHALFLCLSRRERMFGRRPKTRETVCNDIDQDCSVEIVVFVADEIADSANAGPVNPGASAAAAAASSLSSRIAASQMTRS